MPLSPDLTLSVSESLFTELFPDTWIRSKYLNAPLLEERTKYLSHLLLNGGSRERIRTTASMQLHAIERLNMREARPIRTREVQQAGLQRAADLEHSGRKPGKATSYNFVHPVAKWLEFSGLLVPTEAPALPLEREVTHYLEDLRFKQLSGSTIRLRRNQLSKFQLWLVERRNDLREVSLDDIDDFLNVRRARGWGQRTLRNACAIIRSFFRYCELQNWCKASIARGILMPRVTKPQEGPVGPAWKDVRRMLRVDRDDPLELRANAIICLCSIYALRNSEILHLSLDDFDWHNEIMTVRRAKRGGVQQFPIQFEVGKAILTYLKSARPKSSCRCLFTTFRPPIRPMGSTCVQKTVAKRMKNLGIRAQRFGPHALRHSCATELLNKGFSLPEIADFLGHRGLDSVAIYAKFNPRLLRCVASFDLAEIQ